MSANLRSFRGVPFWLLYVGAFLGVVLAVAVAANLFGKGANAATSCGLNSPAFCEQFNSPAGTGNRSGQLNGTLWGVSRVTGNQNFSSPANGWPSANVSICGQTKTISPDSDVFVCNGQLVEGQDDNQTVTAITMYPKQPFDFAGRTGKVVFDVSDNSQGNHSSWPEFWITDKPVPSPFTHEGSFISVPQNGLGIRFAGFSSGSCPEGSPAYVGVDSAIVVNNYVENDTFNGGNLALKGLDCVKEPTAPGQLNHFEVDISQNLIDIYGTDAGTVSPLKHLATIPNAGLTLTRGLIWIEDAHYNGSKFGNQGTNTFTWDNVGFDGPVVAQDRTYDVPDSLTSAGQTDPNNGSAVKNLGYFVPAGTTKTFSIPGVGLANATGALLTYGFYDQSPTTFAMGYSINGHAHSQPWPFPYSLHFSPQTVGVPLTLSEVVAGTNTISFTPAQSVTLMNIDLVMVGAGGVPGGGSPVPTSVPTSTATLTPLPTSTPTSVPPTATATSTPVPTDAPTATDQPVATAEPTAGPTCTPIQVTVRVGDDQRDLSFCQ